jgi:dGTPase
MAVKAERILTDLFNVYCDTPEILPSHIQDTIDERGLHQTVCDYLAGMTDRFAIEEHQKIFQP